MTNRPETGLSPPPGRKLLFAAVVAFMCLAAMEISLQLASVVARQLVSRGQGFGGGEDTVRILCVGDSHTYGLPLPREQSYPSQLERALQERHPRRQFQVANLGIPSLNSAFVANRLERQLFQLRPDVVIVWVGINNQWNPVENQVRRGEDSFLALRQSLMRFRLFRLASLAWFNASGHRYQPEQRGGWFEGELPPSGSLAPGLEAPEPAPGLVRDLERMVELTRAMEIPILFVSYPLKSQENLNRLIEGAAGRLGVPLIRSRSEKERAFRDGHGPDELIDTRAGPHPSGLLYRYVVESMVVQVETLLRAWKGIDLEPAGAQR